VVEASGLEPKRLVVCWTEPRDLPPPENKMPLGITPGRRFISGGGFDSARLGLGRTAAPSGANSAALGSKRARQQFPDCKSARQHVDLAPSPSLKISE
jgi:hypothetical protein